MHSRYFFSANASLLLAANVNIRQGSTRRYTSQPRFFAKFATRCTQRDREDITTRRRTEAGPSVGHIAPFSASILTHSRRKKEEKYDGTCEEAHCVAEWRGTRANIMKNQWQSLWESTLPFPWTTFSEVQAPSPWTYSSFIPGTYLLTAKLKSIAFDSHFMNSWIGMELLTFNSVKGYKSETSNTNETDVAQNAMPSMESC